MPWIHIPKEIQGRFEADMVNTFGNPLSPDPKTASLLEAVYCAMCGVADDDRIKIPPYLVRMLAVYSHVAALNGTVQYSDWEAQKIDHISHSFMYVVAQAIVDNRLRRTEEGHLKIGTLTVPEWYVDFTNEAHREYHKYPPIRLELIKPPCCRQPTTR